MHINPSLLALALLGCGAQSPAEPLGDTAAALSSPPYNRQLRAAALTRRSDGLWQLRVDYRAWADTAGVDLSAELEVRRAGGAVLTVAPLPVPTQAGPGCPHLACTPDSELVVGLPPAAPLKPAEFVVVTISQKSRAAAEVLTLDDTLTVAVP